MNKGEVVLNETLNKWKQTMKKDKDIQISDIFNLSDDDISDEILQEENGIGVVLFESLNQEEPLKQEEVEEMEEYFEEGEQDFQQRMAMFQNRLQQLEQDELFDFEYKEEQ